MSGSNLLNTIVTLELGIATLLVFSKLISWSFSENKQDDSSALRLAFSGHTILFFLLFLAFQGQLLTEGRPILETSAIMPGSYLTRFTEIFCERWLRRLIEPAWWILFFILITLSTASESKKSRIGYQLSTVMLFIALLLEVYVLIFTQNSRALNFLYLSLSQIALVIIPFSVLLFTPKNLKISLKENILICTFLILLTCIFSIFIFKYLKTTAPDTKPLIGAHYYSWFPENWAGGFSYELLSTPVIPKLGKYQSSNPDVFKEHVKMAKEAKIDFFVFDWWPKRREIRKRLEQHILNDNSLEDLKFTFMFEIQDIREKKDKKQYGEDDNVIYLSEERKERLKKYFEYLAKRFMKHPNFLRINNQPVLFIYTTRQLFGPVNSVFKEVRAHIKESTGEKIYLVADEVFHNVASFSKKHGVLLKPNLEPEYDRLSSFDAITAYNPYESQMGEHAGTSGIENFLKDTEEMYLAYSKYAATVGIPFFPGIIPGYNDRGIRLSKNHFVIPRGYEVILGEKRIKKSLFSESINRLVYPFLDKQLPIFAVTSFNEWNEGTQIEPSVTTSETTFDISPSTKDYTQGEAHSGYGYQYLQELSSATNKLNETE